MRKRLLPTLGAAALVLLAIPAAAELQRSPSNDTEERVCGNLPHRPDPDADRVNNPLHWHHSRVANLTLLPTGQLHPASFNLVTEEYEIYTEASDRWRNFDNFSVHGENRDYREDYIDDAGIIWQLISPPKSEYHQPDISRWVDDGGPYSRPTDPGDYPNRKFTTLPDTEGRSFEAVLLPDMDSPSGSHTYNDLKYLTTGPERGTFNWADESVSVTNMAAHWFLDVAPHDLWSDGSSYQDATMQDLLQVPLPEPDESLHDNGMEQLAALSELIDHFEELEGLASGGHPWEVRVRAENGKTRYRLADPPGRILLLDIRAEFSNAFGRYLDFVGLECAPPETDDNPPDGGDRTGAGINVPAPCRDGAPDPDSPLTDNRFFVDDCP